MTMTAIASEMLWMQDERMCPECGCIDPHIVWANGSAEIQCDNCGFSETE